MKSTRAGIHIYTLIIHLYTYIFGFAGSAGVCVVCVVCVGCESCGCVSTAMAGLPARSCHWWKRMRTGRKKSGTEGGVWQSRRHIRRGGIAGSEDLGRGFVRGRRCGFPRDILGRRCREIAAQPQGRKIRPTRVVAQLAGRANRASLEVLEAGTNEARAEEWR